MRRALRGNIATHLRSDANSARKYYVDDCQDCMKRLCRRHFRVSRDRRIAIARLIATHRDGLRARRVDSESQFLAIKKFSCFSRWRRIAARQIQFFERIAGADSDAGSGSRDARCETRRRRGDATPRLAAEVAGRSDAKFAFQQVVDRLRIGLAAA
jgi:hypothetical protein